MINQAELETEEAKYFYDLSGYCHFGIDCNCGGTDGKYSGSHYKNASGWIENGTRLNRTTRVSDDEDKFLHTFYVSETMFFPSLKLEHSEANGQEPLIIVCNDCQREFKFTMESYRNLITKIRKKLL